MPQVRVNGADIYYEELGSGQPFLLLHGMLETGRSYAQLALTLSAHYRVIMPDLRGYGRSGPRPRTFPPDFYTRDAADMIALLRHLQLGAAVVLGVGDGAEVALLVAIGAPELVRAVVALSVGAVFPPSMAAVLPELGAWARDSGTTNQVWRTEAIREYGHDGVQAIWDGWKTAVRAIMADGGDISLARAGTIRCPVLIINGADDPVNTPAMSHALARAIPGAELHLPADARQLLGDRHSRQFTTLMLDWLARH